MPQLATNDIAAPAQSIFNTTSTQTPAGQTSAWTPQQIAAYDQFSQQFYNGLPETAGMSQQQVTDYLRNLWRTDPSKAQQLETQFSNAATTRFGFSSPSVLQALGTVAGGVGAAGLIGWGADAALGAIMGGATGVAPVTSASLAPDTGSLLAANTASPAIGGSISTDIGAGLGAAPSASVLPTSADFSIAAPSISGSLPSIAGASTGGLSSISQLAPKNVISSSLTSAGVPQPIASGVGGAVQGAGLSALRGGNPLTGAITGGVSGGVTGATGSSFAGQVAGLETGAALAPSGGGNMSTPYPMMGAPTNVSTGTVASPQQTATQGVPSLPGTGIPNGPASISPAGLISGTGLATGASPATSSTGTIDPGASATAGVTPPDATSSILSDLGTGAASLLSGAGSALLGGNSVTSMAPYLAIGALGFSQAQQAKNDAQTQANTVAALGAPYTQAGTQLLNQYQSGTLTPAQQSVVDLATKQGNTLLASDPQLQAIYTQAFGDYASGTLRPADQLALDQKVAAQKAQVRQNLSSMGITDSTILAAQDQQIDNQAIMTKQQLLDAQFATGNQAFSTWMKTTTQGQQLLMEGQQFAVTSLQQTLNNALNAGQTGMNPVIQSVQMQIAADAQLGTAVSDLLGNLAKAYAYTQYQQKQPGAATGQTGGGSTPSIPGLSVGGGGITLPSGGGTTLAPGQIPTGTAIQSGLNVTDTGNTGAASSTDVVGPGSAVTDPTTGLPYGISAPTLDAGTVSQDTLNQIYAGSFNPATASTGDLVSYFAGTG